MLQRLLHSLALFVAILVAYQAYVLAMVPWIEPQLALKPSRSVDDDEIVVQGSESVTKYQRLLAAYFPADHWSQTRPPIVIENDAGTVMFVLDEYERSNDGRVDLSHFAFLIFPTPRQASPTPPRNAVILEAPQGARLQFDKNFRPERGEIGSIQRGEFPGKITIRSDMNEPGPDDDLLIETTNLAMNSKLLYTESEVRFRLGPNVGGGRQLEIRLLEEEPSKSQAGLNIASVDSLEIFHDVRLRLHLNTGSLLPGESKQPAAKSPTATKLGDPSQPPVEVTCDGSFHFDFIEYVASFDRNVEVWQVNPQGPADQLRAEQLDLCFARKDKISAAPQLTAAETASRQRADLRLLEPARIVAVGYPVVVSSPARNAEVRGRSVQLLLRERKVAIDGGQDVSLVYGPNELRAPKIRYQHPADDAQTKIGTFRATGPGSLRYLPDERRPDQVFEASWQATVELGRHNGQPVLNVAGRPTLGVTNVGVLTADQVRMFFREVETDGKTQPVPDRMNALGQVEINSRELFARTRTLVANFYDDPPNSAASANEAKQGGSGGLARFGRRGSAGPAARQYQVQSDEMQLRIALRDKRAEPTTLACNGHVAFRELPGPVPSGEEPFEVIGTRLTAERLDGDPLITVSGAVPQGAAGAANPTDDPLAHISARGMTVHAADVNLDVAQNRLWIDGPGTADMLLEKDLTGNATTTPTPLEMRWQGGLSFDGRTITVERDVQVDGPDDHLRCDVVAATLTRHVNFRERVDQNAIDLLEVECRGRVRIDHKSRDDVGITSHERMEVEQLKVNQQTGDIEGDGPGVIRSSHFASQMSALATPGAPDLASGSTKLHFLRVDFQQGLKGNLYLRAITFLSRVRAVYGPIDAWEQELDAQRPEVLPPDTLMLTSNALRVNEDPITAKHRAHDRTTAARLPIGHVQMTAEGNVQINGQSPTKGQFYASADRASYAQAKEQFILEGSNRIPATLAHRNPLTGQQINNSAGKIIYNRITGDTQWDTFRSLEFTPGANPSIKSATGPAAVRQ